MTIDTFNKARAIQFELRNLRDELRELNVIISVSCNRGMIEHYPDNIKKELDELTAYARMLIEDWLKSEIKRLDDEFAKL